MSRSGTPQASASYRIRTDPQVEARRLVSLRLGDTAWQVEADWQDRLFGSDAPDWLALDDDARAVYIKRGHLRSTWRVTLGEHTIYAKTYEGGGLRDRLKRMLVGNPARREWRVAREAARRGVPVVRALAIGSIRRAPHRSMFLSEGLDRAVTLGEAWEDPDVGHSGDPGGTTSEMPPAVPTAQLDFTPGQGDVAESVARLLAIAHERGLYHADSHPGNVLVWRSTNAAIEAVYADLHPVRFCSGAIPRRQAITALAQLDHYFRCHATRSQRLGFLHAYLAFRGDINPAGSAADSTRDWVRAIAAESTRHGVRLARQRDRRLRRNGKYFVTIRVGNGWNATVALKLERRHAFPEVDVADRSCADWAQILKSLPTGRNNAESTDGELDCGSIRYHLNRPASLLSRGFYTLSGAPQRRSFERSHFLRHRDLPAELILGYAEHRTAGLIDATALIMPATGNRREADSGQATS